MIAPFENARVLTGPTGSGKTQLALELAERLGAEIISMDSMALYRGMDIGTAKPSPAERRRIAHHLIDVLDPWESSSVAWWLDRAGECCREIESRGRTVLFVGGTPLYLKALLRGLFEGPPADLDLRERLQREGAAALHARLAVVDPPTAAKLHPNDLRRIIRALEVWEYTGQPISAQQTQWSELRIADCGLRIENQEPAAEAHDPQSANPSIRNPQSAIRNSTQSAIVYLDLPREELYARIDARVEAMFAAGLVDEVAALRRLPRPLGREAGQALGYKEVVEHLDGRATLAETVAKVQQRSRNFAKRQLTWFRNLPGCQAVKRELTFSTWGLTMG
jgi:tRNA dimethylallyltransferase